MSLLALDIGGANLKAADGEGFAHSRPFELWRSPEGLAHELRALQAACPASERWYITMTGELADCFATKKEGVGAILDAVEQAAEGREVGVYGVDGAAMSPRLARENPLLAAASNWRALAAFAARFAGRAPALLIDIGSTTCDILPLFRGESAHRGHTDWERLSRGELVYSGVSRTSVASLCRRLPWGQKRFPVVAETFATTRDAYLWTGDLPEAPDDRRTSDGRPATRDAARGRLARMLGADSDVFDATSAGRLARAIRRRQARLIGRRIERVAGDMRRAPKMCIVSGQGEFLARRALVLAGRRAKVVALSDLIGAEASRCAPAHALAVLARESDLSRRPDEGTKPE